MAVLPTLAAAAAELITITTVVFLIPLPCFCQSQSSNSLYYDACAPSTCGNVTVEFPFTSSETFCGLPGYEVACRSSTPTIELSGRTYQVRGIEHRECLITVADDDLVRDLKSGVCGSLRGRSPPIAKFAPLELPPWPYNLTAFVCTSGRPLPAEFVGAVHNYSSCVGEDLLFYYNRSASVNATPAPCTQSKLPIPGSTIASADLNIDGELLRVLATGFPLQWQNQMDCWNCEDSGGRCGFNRTTATVVCFPCLEGCAGGGGGSKKWKIIVAAAVPAIFVVLVLVASLVKFRGRALSPCCSTSLRRSRSNSGGTDDVQEFIKTYRSSVVSEYSYLDIKKMTDGFKEKLGGGGCGSVYKGKLFTGQLVAVKILEKSQNSGQDFVNEVATIGRIHHVNIIRLLGFCCEGPRRALIYEFMPEGSLGDLISNEQLRPRLGGEGLLNIAIGIARGIEYLHQGCDARILHLDIKPQNVLLDRGFHPKISDFGLAKSYSRREDSVVTLTGARGTVGYIAPEVFLRNIGAVSPKSDVYSFGMVLLEMVVGRRRMREVDSEDSGKSYFPSWIYRQIEEWRETELGSSAVEEKPSTARKMAMVGLWCIQTYPGDRPSMSHALEMLMGGVSGIDLPPRPALFPLPQELLHRGASSVGSGGETMFYSVDESWM